MENPQNIYPDQQNPFDRFNPGLQCIILLALLGGCFFVAQLISGLILIMAYGMSITDLHQVVASGASLHPLRLAQMLATLISFGVPALIFSKLKTGSLVKFSGIQNRFPALLVILVPLLVITAYPLIYLSYYINQQMFFAGWLQSAQDEYKFLVEALLSGTSVSILVINLFTIAVIPAIAEEWFFRGSMQQLLQKNMNPHAAIFITACIFSFIHFDFSAFLPRICLGMLLGYIFFFSGSLWLSIWAHLFNNGMEVILRFLKNTGRIQMEIDDPALPATWEILAFTAGFIVLGTAFYFISRKKFDTFA